MQTPAQFPTTFADFLKSLRQHPEYADDTSDRLLRVSRQTPVTAFDIPDEHVTDYIERLTHSRSDDLRVPLTVPFTAKGDRNSFGAVIRRALFSSGPLAHLPFSPVRENPLQLLLLVYPRAVCDASVSDGSLEQARYRLISSLKLDGLLDFTSPEACQPFARAGEPASVNSLHKLQDECDFALAVMLGLGVGETQCLRIRNFLSTRRNRPAPSPWVQHAVLREGMDIASAPVEFQTSAE